MKNITLCILDGCGIREESDGNAFLNANTPVFDKLMKEYSSSLLNASGPYVGLPKGQMGTSEVGHMNLGSGRVALQPLQAITQSIEDKTIFNNKEILDVLNHVKNNNSNLHIMGLLSDGGVHSHIDHLLGLLDVCKKYNVENVYLHIFTDGRDTYEKSALKYLDILNKKIEEINIGKIATISGRYYAMDRDNNFDRLKLTYDAMCYSSDNKYDSYQDLINNNYNKGIYDEFIVPGVINDVKISDNDGIITFNFRKDRLRELFTCFTNVNEYKSLAEEKNLILKEFNNLKVITMFPVVETVKCNHAFDDLDMKNILSDYLHNNNLSQLRVAETEKFAHVTFYFDGGKEIDYDDEKKILIPSPKVDTYDLKPEMSVYEVTDAYLQNADKYNVTIMNLANGDMVGHTGNYDAAKLAVEHMDKCLEKIYNKVIEMDGILMIIADHGNCDVMWDSEHKPVTSHTTNPVPCIITKKDIKLRDGKLADVAPTILDLLGLEKPSEMTGESLIIK